MTDSLENPAHLAPELAALFPAEVMAAELDRVPDPRLLHEDEAPFVSRAVPKRVQEFTAGRVCARRALAELGIERFSLLPMASGQPAWPAHIVGSITHTNGYAAAVVARSTVVRSLGVDTEVAAAVHADLWSHLFSEQEIAKLHSLAWSAGAAVMFAAKEAFYKCQFPLTSEWVNFHDAEVQFIERGKYGGVFELLPRRALQISQQCPGPLIGRFRIHGLWVTGGMALFP